VNGRQKPIHGAQADLNNSVEVAGQYVGHLILP
jgi:hypothetical protein